MKVAPLAQDLKQELEQLFLSHYSQILKIATNLIGNIEEAKDIVQEGCLKAFKSLPQFKGKSSLKTWLYRIIINTSLKSLRKKDLLRQFKGLISIPLKEQWISKNRKNPAEIIEDQQICNLVQSAVDNLPAKQKTVFVLRFFEEWEIKEIASLLKVKPGTIKTHLLRATKYIIQQLKDNEKRM
jgi:RNA polymerase sigma-70 factor (ECF subfamily)